MSELTKQEEDLMLEEGRERDFERKGKTCEIPDCFQEVDENYFLDDLRVCEFCFTRAQEKGGT